MLNYTDNEILWLANVCLQPLKLLHHILRNNSNTMLIIVQLSTSDSNLHQTLTTLVTAGGSVRPLASEGYLWKSSCDGSSGVFVSTFSSTHFSSFITNNFSNVPKGWNVVCLVQSFRSSPLEVAASSVVVWSSVIPDVRPLTPPHHCLLSQAHLNKTKMTAPAEWN